MATHVKILGWIYLVFGVLGLLSAVLVFVLGVGGGLAAGMEDAAAGAFVGGIGAFAGIMAAILSLPSLLTGWGLLQRKSWARILAVIVGIISLIGFPLGTILGVYTLWVMFQDETKYVLAS